MWILVAAALSQAAPCEQAYTTTDMEAHAERAEAALAEEDVMAHARVFAELREQVPCMQERVDNETWARLLIGYARVEFALEREWRPPVVGAIRAFPEIDRSEAPDDIRQYPAPPVDDTHWVPVATDAKFYLDGNRVDKVPPGVLGGPHIVQSYADALWETRYQLDKAYPSNWTRPSTPTSAASQSTVTRPPAPLIAGLSLAGAGAVTGTATWFASRGATPSTQGQVTTLKAANIAGWGLAGVGTGLVGYYLLGGKKTAAGGPLQGRF